MRYVCYVIPEINSGIFFVEVKPKIRNILDRECVFKKNMLSSYGHDDRLEGLAQYKHLHL